MCLNCVTPEFFWLEEAPQLSAGETSPLVFRKLRQPDTQLVTLWVCQSVFCFLLMLMGFEHPEFSLIFGIGSLSCGPSPVLLPPPTPPPLSSLCSSSKRTLSHLSVLTSAVCPVLPASLWLHLKTLFSVKTHYGKKTDTRANADTVRRWHTHSHSHSHNRKYTWIHTHAVITLQWDEITSVTNINK